MEAVGGWVDDFEEVESQGPAPSSHHTASVGLLSQTPALLLCVCVWGGTAGERGCLSPGLSQSTHPTGHEYLMG